MSDQIIIYGADWCGDCIRAERFLDRFGISYEKINVDQDQNAKDFVIKNDNCIRTNYQSVRKLGCNRMSFQFCKMFSEILWGKTYGIIFMNITWENLKIQSNLF